MEGRVLGIQNREAGRRKEGGEGKLHEVFDIEPTISLKSYIPRRTVVGCIGQSTGRYLAPTHTTGGGERGGGGRGEGYDYRLLYTL